MKIYFISSNTYKINEVKSILESDEITVEGVPIKINEIQSDDMNQIVFGNRELR